MVFHHRNYKKIIKIIFSDGILSHNSTFVFKFKCILIISKSIFGDQFLIMDFVAIKINE
jgi:hypothetical protein